MDSGGDPDPATQMVTHMIDSDLMDHSAIDSAHALLWALEHPAQEGALQQLQRHQEEASALLVDLLGAPAADRVLEVLMHPEPRAGGGSARKKRLGNQLDAPALERLIARLREIYQDNLQLARAFR